MGLQLLYLMKQKFKTPKFAFIDDWHLKLSLYNFSWVIKRLILIIFIRNYTLFWARLSHKVVNRNFRRGKFQIHAGNDMTEISFIKFLAELKMIKLHVLLNCRGPNEQTKMLVFL